MKNDLFHNIPDIEIIDLENDGDTPEAPPLPQPEEGKKADRKSIFSKLPSFLNMHVIFAAVVLLIFIGIFFSIKNWGIRIDLDEIFKDGQGEYSDTLDSILPLFTEGELPADDGVTTIVCFGNAPFADDRNSKDNLANIIAKKTGATVYNCSVSGTYLGALRETFLPDEEPIDAYNFYWLTHLAAGSPVQENYVQAEAALGSNLPPEAIEVYNTLSTLDFNTVDVIAIMYDASDYLIGNPMYDDLNNTHITCFTGNMEAGIELLKSVYPHIRIIVMSPTYAYALNENGEYISSDQMTYKGQDVLSTYVIKQSDSAFNQAVSFIDNLYGTITEDNASKYLTDHIHLNVKGREKVAERFIEFLNYYNK
ncbi:MAG: SGNH/GDSL hydrolase family protein [Lachnospiraceae bacterium]|nr:SGNH/GDSL hydrolase family protein [Lachnospiraceae bacterium]